MMYLLRTAPIRTIAEVIDYVKEFLAEHGRTDEELDNPSKATASIVWMFALFEADAILNSLSTKDLAESLQQGIGPIDEKWVTSYISSTLWEDVDAGDGAIDLLKMAYTILNETIAYDYDISLTKEDSVNEENA